MEHRQLILTLSLVFEPAVPEDLVRVNSAETYVRSDLYESNIYI